MGNVSIHKYLSFTFTNGTIIRAQYLWLMSCEYLMSRVYMLVLFPCCSCWVKCVIAFGLLSATTNCKTFLCKWIEWRLLRYLDGFYDSEDFFSAVPEVIHTSQPILMGISIHPYATLDILVSVGTERSFLLQSYFICDPINRLGRETSYQCGHVIHGLKNMDSVYIQLTGNL